MHQCIGLSEIIEFVPLWKFCWQFSQSFQSYFSTDHSSTTNTTHMLIVFKRCHENNFFTDILPKSPPCGLLNINFLSAFPNNHVFLAY